MENQDWTLQELHVHQSWSKPAGIYEGNIKFKNGVKMELSLILNNEKCTKLISILQDEIVNSAAHLKDLLIKSMPVAIEAKKDELPIG